MHRVRVYDVRCTTNGISDDTRYHENRDGDIMQVKIYDCMVMVANNAKRMSGTQCTFKNRVCSSTRGLHFAQLYTNTKHKKGKAEHLYSALHGLRPL